MPQPDTYQTRVRDEQIRQLLSYTPLIIAANLFAGGLVVFVMSDVVEITALLAWYGALVAVMLYSVVELVRYHRSDSVAGRYRRWMNRVLVACGSAGILWGASGVMFFVPQIEYQAFLLLVLVGMGAGALSMISYQMAYFAYFPISLVPLGVQLLVQDERMAIVLGVMTFYFVGGMSAYARLAGRTLLNSLRLQFENVELVEELRVQKQEAERANVAKSKFLAAASHDLRQPLHALMLFTSALDARVEHPETRDIVDHIKTSSRAMEDLFNTLLDISRLDAGVLQPEPAHFRLELLIDRVLNDFVAAAGAKGIELQHPPCDRVVHSDAVLLERILRNFVANAVRYTERGSVRIACVPLDDGVRLEVHDTGIGIAADQQSEIFREFHQLGNPERDRSKGLGLGLAIVERIARLLQHPVGLRSVPGEGSCFHVTVPRGEEAQVAPARTEGGEPGPGDLGGMQVVVVDDEAGVREGMRTLLTLWGCQVVLAASDTDAVAAVTAAGSAPDAIVVDYRLRDRHTGVQAIERLHAACGRRIPALIITGDIAPESLHAARASGHQLAHKPVRPAVLRAFLRNARIRGHSA